VTILSIGLYIYGAKGEGCRAGTRVRKMLSCECVEIKERDVFGITMIQSNDGVSY
jgi:hypothetical protein